MPISVLLSKFTKLLTEAPINYLFGEDNIVNFDSNVHNYNVDG